MVYNETLLKGERMFNRKPQVNPKLDEVIDEVLNDLKGEHTFSNAYASGVDKLERLYKLKRTPAREKVSPDTLALVIGNLAAVAIVVGYERGNIITSKAWSFLLKAK
jgi:hypothetical protein